MYRPAYQGTPFSIKKKHALRATLRTGFRITTNKIKLYRFVYRRGLTLAAWKIARRQYTILVFGVQKLFDYGRVVVFRSRIQIDVVVETSRQLKSYFLRCRYTDHPTIRLTLRFYIVMPSTYEVRQ